MFLYEFTDILAIERTPVHKCGQLIDDSYHLLLKYPDGWGSC